MGTYGVEPISITARDQSKEFVSARPVGSNAAARKCLKRMDHNRTVSEIPNLKYAFLQYPAVQDAISLSCLALGNQNSLILTLEDAESTKTVLLSVSSG